MVKKLENLEKSQDIIKKNVCQKKMFAENRKRKIIQYYEDAI